MHLVLTNHKYPANVPISNHRATHTNLLKPLEIETTCIRKLLQPLRLNGQALIVYQTWRVFVFVFFTQPHLLHRPFNCSISHLLNLNSTYLFEREFDDKFNEFCVLKSELCEYIKIYANSCLFIIFPLVDFFFIINILHYSCE